MTKDEKRQKAKERTKELLNKLDASISEIQTDEDFKRYLRVMASFHDYSFTNTMLIGAQCPHAQRVAGFKQWQKLGRQVRKGEKSIRIFAPMFVKEKARNKQTDQLEETGEKVMFFRAVPVFDISQTDGDPLPTIEESKILPTHEHLYESLLRFCNASEITVTDAHLAGAWGTSTMGEIALDKHENLTHKSLTLIHEIAHELIHSTIKERVELTKEQKELEAESTAFVVATTLGIETNSDKYMALYRKSYDLKESLDVIHKTSQAILTHLKTDDATPTR